MPFNFYSLLKNNDKLKNMPLIEIKKRQTDKTIIYNKQKNRLDTIAGDIYKDETFWKIILWANPEYFIEFDIPNNTPIRVPFPFRDVLNEVSTKIVLLRDRG